MGQADDTSNTVQAIPQLTLPVACEIVYFVC